MRPTIFRALARAALLGALVIPGAAIAGAPARVGGVHVGFGSRGATFGRPPAGFGGWRRLPAISGVIHERRGYRPWTSAYGHTGTAMPSGFPRRSFGPSYGHVRTAVGPAGIFARRAGYGPFGADRFRRGAVGYGGYGGSFGYGGVPGAYGALDGFAGSGARGAAGDFDAPNTAGYGKTATQSAYGPGPGAAYRSEEPLAVRFAEPPLAPSPYAPYSPGDRYAYAASEDVGPGPRVLRVRPGCACAPARRTEPVIYRYGVGTAY